MQGHLPSFFVMHQGDYFILYFLFERWIANAVTSEQNKTKPQDREVSEGSDCHSCQQWRSLRLSINQGLSACL